MESHKFLNRNITKMPILSKLISKSNKNPYKFTGERGPDELIIQML